MSKSPPSGKTDGTDSKSSGENLSEQEIAERERRVLDHFLTSKPEPHKPIGKKPDAKKSGKKKAPPST